MADSVLKMKTDVENPETGLEHRKRLAGSLAAILADTYLLLVKTQGYHWNVVGPLFVSLHRLTEEQYQNLFEAVDDLAERIRALEHHRDDLPDADRRGHRQGLDRGNG